MANPKMNRTKRMALGGLLAALAVVLLLVGGIFPFATFAAPVFAGVFLMPIAVEATAKTALIAYLAVSVLSFLMVPDREMVLFFIFLFGYYPILQPTLAKIKNRILRGGTKLLLFNAAIAAVYGVLLFLFASAELAQEFAEASPVFWVVILLVANLTFFVYDIMVNRLRIVYIHKFRKRIFR